MTEAETEGGTMYDLMSALDQRERDAFRAKMISAMRTTMAEAQHASANPRASVGASATQLLEVFTDCADAHGDTYPPHVFVQRAARTAAMVPRIWS